MGGFFWGLKLCVCSVSDDMEDDSVLSGKVSGLVSVPRDAVKQSPPPADSVRSVLTCRMMKNRAKLKLID